jgi:hypothetical protein
VNPADLAVIAMTLTSLASTGGLVYTVRRVSPWPKPPAPAQPRTPPAVSGPVPPGGTS